MLHKPDLYHDTVIAGETVLKQDWIEIPTHIIYSEWDAHMVAIEIDESNHIDFDNGGILDANQNGISPEISAILSDGDIYDFVFKGGRLANYKSRNALPDGATVECLKLRSHVPFTASRIFWTDYNVRDLK